MYKESWGLKRICPMCSKQYYDLGREELVCPECGKEIEVTTMSRPRRGRKPGSTNAAPLVNPVPPKPKEKEDELDIENAIPKVVESLGTFQSELVLGGLFTYFISREAYKDGLKVLLFGEGADELFGGYNKYRLFLERSAEFANTMMLNDLHLLWLTHNKRVDHASMAASIEARVPYQDTYVTGNVRRLPVKLKVDLNDKSGNKIALRTIARKYLPDIIALREKEVISRGTDLCKCHTFHTLREYPRSHLARSSLLFFRLYDMSRSAFEGSKHKNQSCSRKP